MGTYTDLVQQEKTTETRKLGKVAGGEKQVRKTTSKGRLAVKVHSDDTVIPRHRDTTIPRYHDTVIELIRRAVKEFGKEAATHRFTLAEKQSLADVIYAYKGSGIKTSENEIARIAINFIVSDYKESGKNSVLEKVLRALNE